MNQGRTIPIKYKFLGVLLSILIASLGVFFFFAYKTFSEDKALFILDLNMSLLKAATSEIKVELKSRLEEIQLLVPRVYHPLPEKDGQKDDPFKGLSSELREEVLGVSFFKKGESGKYEVIRDFINTDLLNKKKLNPHALKEINFKHPLDQAQLTERQGLEMLNRSIRAPTTTGTTQELSILSFILGGSFIDTETKGIIIVIDVIQDFLRRKLDQSEIAELFLISRNGILISHRELTPTVEYSSVAYNHPIVARLQNKTFSRESLELEIGEEPYLCNLSETGFPDIYLVSQIQKSEAFLALRMLLQKSALLAALIFFIALIISLVFAGRLTSNIEKLKMAAEQIGTGNLKVDLDIKTNDEIRNVSESFKWMTNRLSELIDESAKKARMESELQTARLVQSTLLTIPDITSEHVELVSHYVPASECGGDFWDAHLQDNVLTVLIGDATGHGAPAALVTAIAKSCFSTLNTVYTQPLTPEQFLTCLNLIVHGACKGQLLMTCCMAQINLESGELTICNAGHESPLCLRSRRVIQMPGNADNRRRLSTEVLFARGERLGFDPSVVYESSYFQLDRGDTLLLYTDGISEARDASGKEWGERQLRKVFGGKGSRALTLIKNELMDGVNKHTQGAEQADDITFVLIGWKEPERHSLEHDEEMETQSEAVEKSVGYTHTQSDKGKQEVVTIIGPQDDSEPEAA